MGTSLNLRPASFADFRRGAERRLPRFLFDYYDGGAGAEVTLRSNTADWEALRLGQKVLVDASKIDCSVFLPNPFSPAIFPAAAAVFNSASDLISNS